MTKLVQGTAVVWLPVTDIDRSLGFYRDTLGLQEKQSDGDWAQLDANGVAIGLNANESPSGDGGAVVAFQPEGGLDAAVEELRGAGVEIAGDVSEHPWGRVATIKDPDGNDVQLYEPPA
ncbi:MAG: VOC family protein [Solirubrobacteraceae bacterium]